MRIGPALILISLLPVSACAVYPGQPYYGYARPQPDVVYLNPQPYYSPDPYYGRPSYVPPRYYYAPPYLGPSFGFYFRGGGGRSGGWRGGRH